jgi:tellurite resistance protein
MPAAPHLLARPSATVSGVRAAAAEQRAAVLALWQLKRLDTFDIAKMLEIHEAEVERIIHTDREARRKAAVAA